MKKDVLILIWWIVTFRAYKVIIAKHWEDKGMWFHYAVRRAKMTTRKEYREQYKPTKP